MEYSKAKDIRGKSISSLITNRIVSGQGVFSSVRGAMSDKIKARGTGIVEKFDPMNIAKFVTGGSRLAPAVVGRMFGRKQSDIEYFAGKPRRTRTATATPISAPDVSGALGTSSTEILENMFAFLKKNREQDVKIRQTERSFREELANEEEKRRKEFLKALKTYTEVKTTFVAGGPAGESFDAGGFFSRVSDMVKSLVSAAISGIMSTIKKLIEDVGLLWGALKAIDWIKGLKWLAGVGTWARNLLGFTTWKEMLTAAARSSVALAFLAPWLAQGDIREEIRKNPNDPKFKDNPYAMMLRGEAKTEGEAAAINQGRSVKQFRRNIVELFVNDKSRTDEELKMDLGADRATLQNWLKNNKDPGSMWQAPVAPLAGTNRGGTTAGPVETETQRNLKQMNVEEERASTQQVENTATSLPDMPTSAAVSNLTSENLNLQMDSIIKQHAKPIISNSTNSSSSEESTPSTATTRDDTDIIDFVFKRSWSPM